MTISPMLLYIWAGLLFSLAALLVYRGQLTRYENDQLFLHDEGAKTAQRNKLQHDRLLRQLARIKPFVGSFALAAGAVTTMVVALYVHSAWQNIPWHNLHS